MFDVDNKTTGYADTIEYWDTKDVLQIGGYKNEEDFDNIRILETEGIKIAFLGYTYDPYSSNRTSMNKKSEEEGYILPLIQDDIIAKHIPIAKQKADIVIVSVHWGTENVFKPIYEQERLAQLMADYGVDVILGHHSHTLQPVKWLTGTDGNKTLCAYSLGNLISGMLSPKNMVGGFITFDIVKENGKVSVENAIFEPTVCHYVINDFSKKDPEGNPVRTNFQVYMMKDYTQALAAKHGVQNYGKCDLDTLKGFVTSAIPTEFLPDYLK
jgi:poly-gamma-glutamate synthesis protein (capsule biosynthesis protein)